MTDCRQLVAALTLLTERYAVEDYPVLYHQFQTWQAERPLRGMRILDATPVFRNTLLKYRNLIAGGAELTVGAGGLNPYDPEIIAELQNLGIPLSFDAVIPETFDVVLDCSGCHRECRSRFGYAELTRSGILAYEERAKTAPVVAVDSSKIKQIETILGTGESFLRAYDLLYPGAARHEHFLVFGYGKVGRGIVWYLERNGSRVTVVERPERLPQVPDRLQKIACHDISAIQEACRKCDCLIAVTGIKDALRGVLNLQELSKLPIRIAEMGIEDEFGPELAADRVLNAKQPLNFILEDPTRLPFIETTMALSNEAAPILKNSAQKTGFILPDAALEESLLQRAFTGRTGNEIRELYQTLEK